MKNAFSVLLFILLLLILLTACSQSTGNQSIIILLSLDKAEYEVGDEVIAKVTLQNNGNKSELVNNYIAFFFLPQISSPMRGLHFYITDPFGKDYTPHGFLDYKPATIENFVILQEGEYLTEEINLTVHGYEFSMPGVYKIHVNYQNLIDPSDLDTSDHRIAWKGDVDSNEVFITILP